MEKRPRSVSGVNTGALLMACVGVFCARTAMAQAEIDQFRYPIYYKPQELIKDQTNFLKILITGKRAVITGGGTFDINEMRIEYRDADGKTNFVAQAPHCTLSQTKNTASSASRLSLQGDNGLFAQGVGFFCNLTNMTLALSNQVETVFREDISKSVRRRRPPRSSQNTTNAVTNLITGTNGLTNLVAKKGAALNVATNALAENVGTNAVARTNFIRIFADQLFFNYPSNAIAYSNNVRVDSAQFEMACEQLDGKQSTNGTVERIVAQQNVVLFNKTDKSSAYGERAVYQVEEGRETVLLSGERARWQDELREAFARRFWFDLKDQFLRAEENAYFKVPRASIGQQSLLPGKQTTRTNPPPGDLEITAELVTAQLPTTNNPSRTITASTNVVIVSASDKNRATGHEAKYSEATGILELNGNAYWQAGERIISGNTLFVDRTNRVFAVNENAYLRLPASELGKQSLLSPFIAGRTNNPAATNAPPQFLEMWCDNFDYRSDTLTFHERIRGNFLEGTNALGSMTCGLLFFRFNSNQVESVTARDAVHIEQFPYTSSNGTTIAKSLDCELLTALLATNGWIKRVIAETNVTALQVERSKTNTLPVASTLNAQLVVGEFFTHTNQLKELIAIREVALAHGDRKAFGQRAVYSLTNNTVELTGEPTAEFPEGKITEAESLTYDLVQKKFHVLKPRALGERVSPPATNRSNLPSTK